jgi:hypothetical protein
MVSEPTKQRHKTIVARSTVMARSVGNVGVAAFGDISANEQGHFEPHHRGRVVPAFTALSRPLEGDDGSGPAVPVDEHMGQGMHLRLTIHDGATPWCPRRDFHVGRQPRSDNAGKRVIDTPLGGAYRNRLLTYFQKRLTQYRFGYTIVMFWMR